MSEYRKYQRVDVNIFKEIKKELHMKYCPHCRKLVNTITNVYPGRAKTIKNITCSECGGHIVTEKTPVSFGRKKTVTNLIKPKNKNERED